MQKIGKRRIQAGQKQPEWLFPSQQKAAPTPKSQNDDRLKNKKEKQLAKDLLRRRAAGEPPKSAAPPQLLKLVSVFLKEYGFTNAVQALETEREGRGETADQSENIPSLSTIYTEWRGSKDKNKVLGADTSAVEVKSVKKHKPSKQKSDTSSSESDTSSSDSDVEMADAPSTKKLTSRRSSSSSSASSSSSDSDADDEEEVLLKIQSPKPKVNGLKRKVASSSESSSGSDPSSDEDGPKSKKVKTEVAADSSDSDSSSEEDSSSSSNSTSEDESLKDKESKVAVISSGSESSSSDSDSDSDSSTNSIAQKVPLPDSDSDSESSSESSSESGSESSVGEAKKKPVVGSDTSATLSDGPKKISPSDDSSPDSTSSSDSEAESKPVKIDTKVTTSAERELSPPLPPDPVSKLPKNKINQPFSRIPKDIKVDERLASNAYVPYDYAQKAHEDLIVTRGKGFTKEKNKKKRGSYKGGYIDVEGKKGIKFED